MKKGQCKECGSVQYRDAPYHAQDCTQQGMKNDETIAIQTTPDISKVVEKKVKSLPHMALNLELPGEVFDAYSIWLRQALIEMYELGQKDSQWNALNEKDYERGISQERERILEALPKNPVEDSDYKFRGSTYHGFELALEEIRQIIQSPIE